jgi:hypothetical protein
MKTTLAAVSFALAMTASSILAPSTPAVAEANRHGYINDRNYDDGPESLAAFRAYHRNARLNATARSQSSVSSSTPTQAVLQGDRAAADSVHCDLAPRVGLQDSTPLARC